MQCELDGVAGLPGVTLDAYAARCSACVDHAGHGWPVAARNASGGRVSSGFFGDAEGRDWRGARPVLSTLWVQEFAVGSAAELDALLAAFDALFQGTDIAEHAREWDQTFVAAQVLGTARDDDDDDDDDDGGRGALVLHWQFAAAPLAGRDMVYAVAAKRQQLDDGATQTTYSYASVSDAWAARATGKPVPTTGRVRAVNLFPSCDRITVSADRRTVTVEHLMTTGIGGWVPTLCFNNLFKKALIQANTHEAGAMREYVLKLAQKSRAQKSRDEE